MSNLYDLNGTLKRINRETAELKASGKWNESHVEIADYAVKLIKAGLAHERIASDYNIEVVEAMGATTDIAREVVLAVSRASDLDSTVSDECRYFFRDACKYNLNKTHSIAVAEIRDRMIASNFAEVLDFDDAELSPTALLLLSLPNLA